MEVSGVLDFDK